MRPMKKGDRVRWNERGRRTARYPDRLGTYAGPTRRGDGERVHWDGTLAAKEINRGFIELAEPDKEAEEMKAYVFYVSDNPGPNRQRVSLPDGGAAFVRVQVFVNSTTTDALDCAEPEADESVMNSHELKGERR